MTRVTVLSITYSSPSFLFFFFLASTLYPYNGFAQYGRFYRLSLEGKFIQNALNIHTLSSKGKNSEAVIQELFATLQLVA